MTNIFKESLFVQNSNEIIKNKKRVETTNNNIEEAYIRHIRLKNDPQFLLMVINKLMQTTLLFKKNYPNVTIETPRGRIKSNVSIKNKLKNLEIERLCKLYAVDEISNDEKEFLKRALFELIKNSKEDINEIFIKQIIESIFEDEIKGLDTIRYIVNQSISEKAKTALLRITKARLQQENLDNSQQLQEKLGQISIMHETCPVTGKKIFYDILKWKDIAEINPQMPDFEEKMRKLHNPKEYLILKDLIGMQIVVCNIPDDIETNNQELKTLLQIRKKVRELMLKKKEQIGNRELNQEEMQEIKEIEEQYNEYTENCRIEITKEFGTVLKDVSTLSGLDLNLEKYKSKYKENGYRAEHLKYSLVDNPNYTFELQLRSLGCEIETKLGGKTPHSNRDGKEQRNIYNLPQYFILNENSLNQSFTPHLCTKAENIDKFLRGYIPNEDLKKLMNQWVRGN